MRVDNISNVAVVNVGILFAALLSLISFPFFFALASDLLLLGLTRFLDDEVLHSAELFEEFLQVSFLERESVRDGNAQDAQVVTEC